MSLSDHIVFWARLNALPVLTPGELEELELRALAVTCPLSFAQLVDLKGHLERAGTARLFPHQQRLLEGILRGDRVVIGGRYYGKSDTLERLKEYNDTADLIWRHTKRHIKE